ncbi:MAG: ABC transporter substrate-binding protein [Candidatus Borkfalkiaceae bacterium]|nr:ABC transporter substrate-binding protein [Clostridia bacterium]MDY6222759.1 ABC transporter substrate-binding protein [Christensenellaceae bacterium]
MKKTGKIVSLAMTAAFGVSFFTGCGGSNSDAVTFWVTGTAEQLSMYTALEKAFNETYGAEHGIEVKTSQRPVGSYESNIQITAGSKSGPDVYLIRDDVNIKKWIVGRYLTEITDEYNAITDMDMGNVSSKVYENLRYDEKTNTSHETDSLYGVPLDKQTTALFYNKTMLKNAGILEISVDEEDLVAWSNGEIADKNGLKITDPACAELKALLEEKGKTMPAKGYFRSEKPYHYDYGGTGATQWRVPDTDSEVLVFNNRIPMNWDEMEDVAMLFTKEWNTQSKSTYGYFTEWWFEYGWSVGGDCLTDLTGNGDWNFSLLDPNPNYIVTEGTFTGRTGKVYQAGETIDFADKMDIGEGEVLNPVQDVDASGNLPADYGDYRKADGTTAGVWSGIEDELAKGDASALKELPSMRTAFERYLKLGTSTQTQIGDGRGLEISPKPTTVNSRGLISYFLSEEVVFAASKSNMLVEFASRSDAAGFEFDMAPLLVYKEYTDPSDPFCDTVAAEGKQAGHANCVSAVVREGSQKKEKAVTFLKWCMSVEGQKVRANAGFFPMDESLFGELKLPGIVKANNTRVLYEALSYEKPGDWWYMPDEVWVERWCSDLNSSLRNGTMTYEEWLKGKNTSVAGGAVIKRTNDYLKEYK